ILEKENQKKFCRVRPPSGKTQRCKYALCPTTMSCQRSSAWKFRLPISRTQPNITCLNRKTIMNQQHGWKMKARNREGIRYNFNQIRFKYSSNQSQILFLFYAYAILI